MAETISLHLGGRDFLVRPLTFRQLREIEEALGRTAKPGADTRIDFDAAIDILATALNRIDPGMNREALLDLEGTKTEIVAAVREVLRLSGYIERGSNSSGEASAGH